MKEKQLKKKSQHIVCLFVEYPQKTRFALYMNEVLICAGGENCDSSKVICASKQTNLEIFKKLGRRLSELEGVEFAFTSCDSLPI